MSRQIRKVEQGMDEESNSKNPTEKRSRACLSKNLIDYRKRLNISREHLALDCEVDVKYLSRIETGSANTSLDVLDKLSDGTGIAAGELITK